MENQSPPTEREKELINVISDLLQMIDHGGPTEKGHSGSCGPWADCDYSCMCAYYDGMTLWKAREIVENAEKILGKDRFIK